MRGWTFKIGPAFNDDRNDERLLDAIYDRFADRFNDELWMFAANPTYLGRLPTEGFYKAEVWIDDDVTRTEDDRSFNHQGFLIPDKDDMRTISTWLANYDGLYDLKEY